MKILITGGSGLLGQYLNLRLSVSNEVLTIFNSNEGNCSHYNSAQVDITDFIKLKSVFSLFKPDVVIHTAAVSTPQKASAMSSKDVYRINVSATKTIAEFCNLYEAKLIYTSTDLVYAGYRGSMLNEDSKLIPISLYAETKLMGERKIQETFDNYIILRTALLYGFGLNSSLSHFHEMYFKLKAGEKVKLFHDQFRTPLSLMNAAKMFEKIVKLDIKKEIFNFGGKERVSRVELGRKLCNAIEADESLVEEISMNDIPGFPVVNDVSMNTDKLRSFGISSKSVEESIEEILMNK